MENQTYEAGFWDDPAKAQELISQLNRKRDIVKGYQQTAAAYDEAEAALELALEDDSFSREAQKAAATFSRLLEDL